MGFFKSKKGSIISDYFQSVDKIGNYGAGIMLEVSLYDTYLTISCPGGKQEITLNYNQITDVSYGAKTEIKEKNAKRNFNHRKNKKAIKKCQKSINAITMAPAQARNFF